MTPTGTAFLRRLRDSWSRFFSLRCLTGFPWFLPAQPAGRHAMSEARRIARLSFGRERPRLYRSLAYIFVAAIWPPAALIHMFQTRRRRGGSEVPLKRFPGAFWAAIRNNVLPGEYFAYQLWIPERRAHIDEYLYSNECARLFGVLNRREKEDPIDDKLMFYRMCSKFSFPTPPILAAFGPSGQLSNPATDWPPRYDIFVKPRIGLAGEGSERLRWNGTVFETDRGRHIRSEFLDDYLTCRARNKSRNLIVQPLLLSHPDLRSARRNSLAVARLVTGFKSKDEVLPIFGFTYFCHPMLAAGQRRYATLIDVKSGQLRPRGTFIGGAPDISPGYQGSTSALPDWDKALRYAKAAHLACSAYTFIGWDIAFTNQGPFLLEGNANWSADEYQAISGQPLGHTDFVDVLEHRLQKFKV